MNIVAIISLFFYIKYLLYQSILIKYIKMNNCLQTILVYLFHQFFRRDSYLIYTVYESTN